MTNHFLDINIYNDVFKSNIYENNFENRRLNYNKINLQREIIKNISITEDTNDFLIVSKNYFSMYTINGVLLAIEKSEEKINTGIIVRNKTIFEDNYVILAHFPCSFSFWIIKLDENKANLMKKKIILIL